MKLEIKTISTIETYAVRHPVLRGGLPIESCAFDGDELPTTTHLGAFHEGELIGIISIFKADHATIKSEKTFQLRGMGILEKFQKKGIGKALIDEAEKQIWEQGATLIWLNARIIALPFYEGLGYSKQGDYFMIEYAGKHICCLKTQKP